PLSHISARSFYFSPTLPFFFQAEDGIRDFHVTGVRRVLFRSVWRHALHLNQPGDAVYQYASFATASARQNQLMTGRSSNCLALRSEERRVGKEWRWRWGPSRKRTKRGTRVRRGAPARTGAERS